MKCDNESCDNGSVQVEVLNFAYDQFAAPDYKLEPCEFCGGSGEINDNEN